MDINCKYFFNSQDSLDICKEQVTIHKLKI